MSGCIYLIWKQAIRKHVKCIMKLLEKILEAAFDS